MPKISIVTVSYNQAEFLAEAMDSVLGQDHQDVEYVIVDPGSTDGSLDIIRSRRERLTAVITGPDRGPAHGLNRGFDVATGEIFGYLNSDDRLLPGALRLVAQAFDDDPALDILSGHLRIIDKAGRLRRMAFTDQFSRLGLAYGTWTICQQSTFFRAATYRTAGGFNPSDKVSWDHDLMVRIFLSAPRHRIIDRVLGEFRVYDESITGSQRFENESMSMSVRHFRLIMGRDWRGYDPMMRYLMVAIKYARQPRSLLERLRRGSIFGPGGRSPTSTVKAGKR
jgi:glycosyltransferase involved in cell wall biosynthesis